MKVQHVHIFCSTLYSVSEHYISQLKEEIKQLKNDIISEFLRELTNDSSTEYSLWITTKNLKRSIMQTPPINKLDGSWARNNE
jgi:hypothetical protein